MTTNKKEKRVETKKESKTEASDAKTITVEQKDKTSFFHKVSGVAEKGMESFKKGVEKVAHFTSSSAKLAKLKVEIHNLENEHEKLNFEAGQKLWQMHKDNKLNDIESAFANEFKKLTDLHKQTATKEKQVEKISLIE